MMLIPSKGRRGSMLRDNVHLGVRSEDGEELLQCFFR